MHHGIHLGADADGLHDLDAQALHQVTGNDDLAYESLGQARLTCNALVN